MPGIVHIAQIAAAATARSKGKETAAAAYLGGNYQHHAAIGTVPMVFTSSVQVELDSTLSPPEYTPHPPQ